MSHWSKTKHQHRKINRNTIIGPPRACSHRYCSQYWWLHMQEWWGLKITQSGQAGEKIIKTAKKKKMMATWVWAIPLCSDLNLVVHVAVGTVYRTSGWMHKECLVVHVLTLILRWKWSLSDVCWFVILDLLGWDGMGNIRYFCVRMILCHQGSL